ARGVAALARGYEREVAVLEPLAELALRLLDAPAEVIVQLDREVGDALRRQVGSDVELLAPHNAHVDDSLPRLGEEAEVRRREPGLLKLGHELERGLLAVDPAEELPDCPEVLDRVDERGAREGDHEGARP